MIEFLTLQWLREIVCNHISRGTILYVQLINLDSVSDEVILDGNMLCPFTAGIPTVKIEQNWSLVVLI